MHTRTKYFKIVLKPEIKFPVPSLHYGNCILGSKPSEIGEKISGFDNRRNYLRFQVLKPEK